MFAVISSGHADLADVLYLIAVIVFVVEAVLRFTAHPETSGALVPIGLALVAAAFLVL